MTALAFLHRWLGIAGGALFALWFASGIAMIYVRMPTVSEADRLSRLAPIDGARIGVGVGAAAATAAVTSADDVRLEMLDGRPVYRFAAAQRSVFADSGHLVGPVGRDQALAVAREFVAAAEAVTYAELATAPDQWTLQLRPHLPLHRVRVDDAAGTMLYVSSVTGEVVMHTTRRSRWLAYLGPIPHWLYVPALRRDGALWSRVVVGVSLLGCIACLSGLAVGAWRLSIRRRYRRRGHPTVTPYRGWLRWHHYAGLLFGVVTFTWTFSGLLSMDPLPQLSTGGASDAQRLAVRGAGDDVARIDAGAVRAAVRAADATLVPKALILTRFAGVTYWLVLEHPTRSALVAATGSGTGTRDGFSVAEVETVARAALPGPIADLAWLDADDGYYSARAEPRPLPVLRARSADAEATWLYLDPRTGAIAQVLRRPDRVNRWLYHGLHSLDPIWLRTRRPLWDAVVIVLSAGGLALAATSAVPGWRRLGRAVTRRPSPPDHAC